MPITNLQADILVAIRQLGPRAWPANIAQAVSAMRNKPTQIGTITTRLKKLQAQNYITFSELDARPTPGGKRVKVWAIKEP